MRVKLFKALAPSLMLLAMFSAPAGADDEKSCFSNDPDQIIRGCSRIIANGQAPRSQIGKAHGSRGWAFVRKKQYDEAIADFDKAISIEPDVGFYYFYRGLSYANKAQFDRANADYTQSIRLDPNRAGAYVNRGSVYARMGHRELAIDDFNKALELKPTLEIAKRNLRRLGVSPRPVPQSGSKSTLEPAGEPLVDIAEFQRALANLGYDPGPIDGAMGGRTRDAIRRYQGDGGLAVDGEPSAALLARLQKDLVESRAGGKAVERPRVERKPAKLDDDLGDLEGLDSLD